MTVPLSAAEVGGRIRGKFPEAVEFAEGNCLGIRREFLPEVARYLKEEEKLDYLSNLTSVDYWDHFEVVYHLFSIERNVSLTLKVKCPRDDARIPSLTPLWKGAELQEREVYDLMGIIFEGHPNLKRILLWEGFKGHPLRKDFL